MPLPQGFVLEQPPQQPKLPEGFVLEGQQPSAVLNQNKTPPEPGVGPLQLGGLVPSGGMTIPTNVPPLTAGKVFLNAGPMLAQDMPPGVGKALMEQMSVPNALQAAVIPPGFKILSQSGLLGKAVIAGLLGHFAKAGAEQAGTTAGQLSVETDPRQQQYLASQLALNALPALGATVPLPFLRSELPQTGIRHTTGLKTEDIADITEGRERIPPSRQLQAPTRFYGGSSASPVIDASLLSPNELTEAQRLAQANATMQERQLADIASKKKYGGEIPIIGQGPVAPKPVSLQQQFTPTGELIKSSELETQPKEVQGGQVSFSGEAKAGAIPSARQAALEDVRPAVRTMDNKIYVGAKGDSHNDIITKNNLSPTMIDRRMFVDGKGNPISREDLAKQGVPGEPTSVPGAHSTGLTKVQEGGELTPITTLKGIPVYSSREAAKSLARRYGPANFVPTRLKESGVVDLNDKGLSLFVDDSQGGKPIAYFTQDPERILKMVQEQEGDSQRLSDVARFQELGKIFAKGDMDSPEFMQAWQEREQIKNKYGGHTPDTQEAIDYAKNVRTNPGQPKEAGVQDQGRKENSGGNVQQTQGEQKTSYEAKPIVGGEPQQLHSGIPVPEEVGKYAYAAGRAFVSQAEKILRDPQAIGFSATAQVDAEQLKNRLRNKVGAESTEWKMMQDAGIDKVKGKMTAQQMAEWVKENGPRLEVRKFGSAKPQQDAQRQAIQTAERDMLSAQHMLETKGYRISDADQGPFVGALIDKNDHLLVKQGGQIYTYQRRSEKLLGQSPIEAADEHVQKYFKAKEDFERIGRTEQPGDTSHWQSIAPKSESQMPGYVEIALVKPGPVKFKGGGPEAHYFPDNPVGFLRGYMETDPKTGEKTFHVIEVQSDWAQRVREENEYVKKEDYRVGQRVAITPQDPLLPHYERLLLKAAIDHARSEGATRIAISDAETAMMTEGHDRPSEIRPSGLTFVPKQSEGMRLHYDRTLPKIAEELTGEKGERVEFGEHKMALDEQAMRANERWVPPLTPEELARENKGLYRKDLIFRNEAGQPKTDVTARSYSIAKPKERLESGEPQTTTGRTYGGIPFLAPEFYTPLIKDIKIGANKASESLSNLLERGKLTEAIARKYDAIRGVSQRVADQLSNNIRGPIERTFGKKDQDLAEQALSLVRESKENRATLQGQYDRRGELSGLPKWQERWSKAAQFALSNWDKLTPISQRYQAYTDQVLSRLSDVDRPIERRAGYVRHLPESSDNVTGFRRAREYETFFDRIKGGSDPKSLNSVDLLKSTIYDAHRSYIQSKAFNDWMTKIKAPNGKPLAKGVADYEKIKRTKLVERNGKIIEIGKNRQPDIRPPSGYSEIAVGGQRIAVQDEYKGLLQRLTNASWFESSTFKKGLQEYAGLAKHIQFAVDLVHLGRMARIEMAAKGGTGNLPIPSYRKGILTLDYTPQELEAKSKAGEIDPKELPELLENRRINNKLVEGGFNVGHYADALRSNWVEKIPVSGAVQRYIFNVFTRGAMAEVGPIVYRLYKKDYPKLSDAEVVGKVVHDLNFTFRNLGKQGPVKSATGDDILRLVVAAPQWTIGTPMYEAQAIGGAAKGIVTGKFNIQSRTVGTMIAAYLVANQIINYATTGHSTFENEKGHKIDAWVPTGNGNGYWIGPEAAALETVNRVEQVANKSETFLEGAKNYIDPKLSTIGKAAATAATGHKYGLTGPLLPKKEQMTAAAEQLLPRPIAASAATKEGQLVPQLMKTVGLEGQPALSDRQKMYQAAREWMQKNNVKEPEGQFPESPYQPLNDALRKGDVQGAKVAYEKLKGEVKDEYIQKYYKNITNRGFAGSEENDKAFRASLAPDQQAIYDRAKAENEKVKAAFFQMLGEKEPPAAKEKSKSKRQKKFKLFGE